VTIYGITTKFGIRMCLYPIYQISTELDNVFVFYNNFHTLTKRRETKPIFEGSYLVQFSWNLKCEAMILAGISKNGLITELRKHENRIIVLPVNNSRVWRAGTTVCLDQLKIQLV